MGTFVNQIKINEDTCINCQLCYRICFVDVYRWNEESQHPVVAYPEDCVDCAMCEAFCPSGSVHLNVDFAKPSPAAY